MNLLVLVIGAVNSVENTQLQRAYAAKPGVHNSSRFVKKMLKTHFSAAPPFNC
jgi:hypothetical protein